MAQRAYLARSIFNNLADIDIALERMGVSKSVSDPHKQVLAAMMIRRHWIVHRADHNEGAVGPRRQRIRQIGQRIVWAHLLQLFEARQLTPIEFVFTNTPQEDAEIAESAVA